MLFSREKKGAPPLKMVLSLRDLLYWLLRQILWAWVGIHSRQVLRSLLIFGHFEGKMPAVDKDSMKIFHEKACDKFFASKKSLKITFIVIFCQMLCSGLVACLTRKTLINRTDFEEVFQSDTDQPPIWPPTPVTTS